MGGTDSAAVLPQHRLQSRVTVMGCDRAFSLPAYRALSHVRLESKPPLPGPPPIPVSTPSPVPDPNILFLSSINLYLSLYSRRLKSKPGDDSDCWWASQRCPPLPLPHLLPPTGGLGRSRVWARHPIACDSMRAADLRKEVSSCWNTGCDSGAD